MKLGPHWSFNCFGCWSEAPALARARRERDGAREKGWRGMDGWMDGGREGGREGGRQGGREAGRERTVLHSRTMRHTMLIHLYLCLNESKECF